MIYEKMMSAVWRGGDFDVYSLMHHHGLMRTLNLASLPGRAAWIGDLDLLETTLASNNI